MKLLKACVVAIGLYSTAGQAAWLCDPNPGGAGCMECSERFCAYGSDGTGYICLHIAPDKGLDTSAGAVSRVNEEAKKFTNSPNANIKAMAESLVNLTVSQARIMAEKQQKGTAKKAMALPQAKPMMSQ
ncbi:hypothetical protein [uncultured Amphritea sp.]|uniref:hypothetical protein n=1 Tax=uncultured Amphritea sp. TaxID=981605 RepID=UPI00263926DA|nr:hypothetical protein [uncultured Amphritea sp.]